MAPDRIPRSRLIPSAVAMLALTGCATTTAAGSSAATTPPVSAHCGEARQADVDAVLSASGKISMSVRKAVVITDQGASRTVAISFVDRSRTDTPLKRGIWKLDAPQVYSLSMSAHVASNWPYQEPDPAVIEEVDRCLPAAEYGTPTEFPDI